ncbi:MAG: DUF1803 domain-containing protein [Streptococcaceae bacterium]|jgi:predicted transcriptional regulator|nr:DUF1803 domain-containing protein [Streptococcaceae bacterium]
MKFYNESRLMRQPFFQALVPVLENRPTLREIHAKLPNYAHIDREVEKLVNEGLVAREEKHYRLGIEVVNDVASGVKKTAPQINVYERPFAVVDGALQDLLDASLIYQETCGIFERSRFDRTTPTLGNYFYKLAENLPLSEFEKEIYQLIGDVDSNYACNFIRAEIETGAGKSAVFAEVVKRYGLTAENLQNPELTRVTFENAEDFVREQVRQKLW